MKYMKPDCIYKVFTRDQWGDAQANLLFTGAPVDLADGFIHFSTAAQVEETVAKHFRGQTNLILATFNASDFGDALKWEVSRGGDLFPHLYDKLDITKCVSSYELEDAADGSHRFPEVF